MVQFLLPKIKAESFLKEFSLKFLVKEKFLSGGACSS